MGMGELLIMDIERLLLSEDDDRFDFVNGIAGEAKHYFENNREEYLGYLRLLVGGNWRSGGGVVSVA